MAVDQRRDYVVWSPPGGGPSVRIASSVVDRLNVDVMRGFGVTRRRGTETGGVLLGRVDSGSVWIEDYEEVPCEYAYGPSYLLSDVDKAGFRGVMERWSAGPTRAVGYYRSHTRDGLQLDQADVELFERFFSGGNGVALLVRPFATRTARASFFVPAAGRLVAGAAVDEFPFTTQVTEDPPQPAVARPAPPPVPAPVTPPVERWPEPETETLREPEAASEPEREPEPAVVPLAAQPPVKPPDADRILANVLGPKNHALDERDQYFDRTAPDFGHYQRPRSRWKRAASWMAFALALFSFGAAAGFRYAGGKAVVEAPAKAPPDPYTTSLSVEPQGSNLLVRWDREAPMMRSASRGVLTISDPNGSKEVPLAAAELRNGTVIYQGSAAEITFRLELFFSENRHYVEIATWRSPTAAP